MTAMGHGHQRRWHIHAADGGRGHSLVIPHSTDLRVAPEADPGTRFWTSVVSLGGPEGRREVKQEKGRSQSWVIGEQALGRPLSQS